MGWLLGVVVEEMSGDETGEAGWSQTRWEVWTLT